MKIGEIISVLDAWAPSYLAEGYDNVGLITGNADQAITGVLVCLDSTEEVIQEAIDKKCNLVIAHHPIIFKGLKKLVGGNHVERTVIKAIQHDIAIYASHTNLDNLPNGVSKKIASVLELNQVDILEPNKVYNDQPAGSGCTGILPFAMEPQEFLDYVKNKMKLQVIRHTSYINREIKKVAVCGGSGAFLIYAAQNSMADAYITADIKYHEFFSAEDSLMILDIGHYESEFFTMDLMADYLKTFDKEFPTFITTVNTNPVKYFL